MNKSIALIFAAIAASTSVTAHAEDGDNARLSVGLTGGTLGIGPEVGYRVSEMFGVRANATFLNISRGIDSSGINYDGKAKLKSGGVMVDVYPFGGGFRLSGGLRINGNEARVVATPTTSVQVGNNNYQPQEIGTLRTETDLKSLAPTLTVGYGGGLSKGLVFGIEGGAMFQGKMKIKPLTYTGNVALGTIATDLENERREIEDDIDGFKVYPILQLTLGYRF